MSDMDTRHACQMPKWRVYKWRHRIYLCDCDLMWTIRTSVWAGPHGPTNSYRWVQVGVFSDTPGEVLDKVCEVE